MATSYLDGVFPIRYETTTAIAAALANLIVYDLSPDYYDSYRANVRAVTAVEVLAAARAHIHPDRLQLVVVGDPAAVRGPLEEIGFGPVTVYDDHGDRIRVSNRVGSQRIYTGRIFNLDLDQVRFPTAPSASSR